MNYFANPAILNWGEEPGEGGVHGAGSGQAGQEPWAMSFAEWKTNFAYDYSGDNKIDETDFCMWWLDSGLSWEDFLKFNSESDWKLPERPKSNTP